MATNDNDTALSPGEFADTPVVSPAPVASPVSSSSADVNLPSGINTANAGDIDGSNITTPTIAPSTSTTGALAAIGSTTQSNQDDFDAQQEQDIKNLQAQQATRKTAIQSIFDKLSGTAAETNDLYESTGVDTDKKALDEINNQIEAEQVSTKHRIDTLKANNTNGLFGGALQDEVDRINNASLSRQADLAVVQNAALNKYSTMKDIADRQIAAETDGLKTQLQSLQYFYDDNKDQLSKKEDEQYQEAITQKTNEYNEAVADKKQLSDTKLSLLQSAASQGAPVSVLSAIQGASTPEDAITAAGQYSGDILARRVQQAQLDAANTKNNPDATDTVSQEEQSAQSASNIDLINSLQSSKGLSAAVGTTGFFGRGGLIRGAVGAKADFLAGTQQLLSQLSLSSLENAKANGATFGALSEGELNILSSSASKLNSLAIKDKDGNITGFKGTEANFKAELDKINNFAKLDYILKGGDPTQVGVQKQPDGTYWTQNSDGSLTLIQ